MIKEIAQGLLKLVINPKHYLNFSNTGKKRNSVYFYTFHKCASTLFSSYVLKNIEGLNHIDYASQIYNGKQFDSLIFENEGFVYGPIRLSANPESPVYKKLVQPVSNSDFIQDKIAIFLVRDPRDILVSAYYSFGYTHGLSSVPEIQEEQEKTKSEIQSQTIDEYAMKSAHRILSHFETVDKLSKACNRSVILKYEDMVDNWDFFAKNLTKYIDINQTVIAQIYEKSRPMEKEDITSHRRSGKTGDFRSKLKAETIISLNTTFKAILERFQYET